MDLVVGAPVGSAKRVHERGGAPAGIFPAASSPHTTPSGRWLASGRGMPGEGTRRGADGPDGTPSTAARQGPLQGHAVWDTPGWTEATESRWSPLRQCHRHECPLWGAEAGQRGRPRARPSNPSRSTIAIVGASSAPPPLAPSRLRCAPAPAGRGLSTATVGGGWRDRAGPGRTSRGGPSSTRCFAPDCWSTPSCVRWRASAPSSSAGGCAQIGVNPLERLCREEGHRRIEGVEQDIDVLFVGSMLPRRAAILDRLARRLTTSSAGRLPTRWCTCSTTPRSCSTSTPRGRDGWGDPRVRGAGVPSLYGHRAASGKTIPFHSGERLIEATRHRRDGIGHGPLSRGQATSKCGRSATRKPSSITPTEPAPPRNRQSARRASSTVRIDQQEDHPGRQWNSGVSQARARPMGGLASGIGWDGVV